MGLEQSRKWGRSFCTPGQDGGSMGTGGGECRWVCQLDAVCVPNSFFWSQFECAVFVLWIEEIVCSQKSSMAAIFLQFSCLRMFGLRVSLTIECNVCTITQDVECLNGGDFVWRVIHHFGMLEDFKSSYIVRADGSLWLMPGILLKLKH